MNKPHVTFFPNGNVMAFVAEEQVSVLQESYIQRWALTAHEAGFDPTEFVVTLPYDQKARIFKTDEGYNWKIL